MIIGIEGPPGSGKTTMARTVAAELGWVVVEGGLWYRALTYFALQAGIDPSETAQLLQLMAGMELTLKPGQRGVTIIMSRGQDITTALYDSAVSASIASYAQNLEVRKAVEPLIATEVRAHDPVIVVGRHLKKLLPEAAVLRLTIEATEADRRAGIRKTGQSKIAVGARNTADQQTARLLGETDEGVTVVDVTAMTNHDQAELLRNFVAEA